MVQPDIPVEIGDRVLMRKPHPCGSLEWTITRVGADIGLQCIGCGRRVLLPRREFARNTKRILSATPPGDRDEDKR